jgi:hypothetical protein
VFSAAQFCNLNNETDRRNAHGSGLGGYHWRFTVSARTSTTDHLARMFCLSIHAGYRCQHAGACCTAGWHIPAESPVVAALELHFGRHSGSAVQGRFLEATESPHAPAILATKQDGACAFFDADHGRLCVIHRDLGERMLPSACRHFPRVTLADARGTWITLSHFCPTAASLLFTPAPLRIVSAPDSLTLSGTAEGLDATAALPPLLRPGMLMDFEGYEAWERACIEVLDTRGPDVNAALAAVHGATREIRQWSPGGEPLRDRVTRILSTFSTTGAPCSTIAADPVADARRHALAVASVPAGLTVPDAAPLPDAHRPDIAPLWREFDDVIRRYLASKLFASWWPYLGLDLMAVVEAIQVHAAVLRRRIALRLDRHDRPREVMLEAIRDTDLLMVHLSDGRALARLITQES